MNDADLEQLVGSLLKAHPKNMKLATKVLNASLGSEDNVENRFIPNHDPAIVGSYYSEDLRVYIGQFQRMTKRRRHHYLMQLINCGNPNRAVYHLGESMMYRNTIGWLLARLLIRPREPGDQEDKAYLATDAGNYLLAQFMDDVLEIWYVNWGNQSVAGLAWLNPYIEGSV